MLSAIKVKTLSFKDNPHEQALHRLKQLTRSKRKLPINHTTRKPGPFEPQRRRPHPIHHISPSFFCSCANSIDAARACTHPKETKLRVPSLPRTYHLSHDLQPSSTHEATSPAWSHFITPWTKSLKKGKLRRSHQPRLCRRALMSHFLPHP